MAITNATRLSDFAAGIGTEGAILKIDNANQRVGIGTQLPDQMLQVAGIVSATQYIGDGSLLEGITSAGLGTAIDDTDGSAGAVIYYTNDLLSVSETTTVNPPTSASAAYTQYRDVKLEDNVDLIIETGDDFIPDVLGLGTDASDPTLSGNGVFDEVYTSIIKNKDGFGAPVFPNGLTSVGVITAASGSFSGNVTVGGVLTYEDVTNVDSVGLITARTGIKVTAGGIDVTGNSSIAGNLTLPTADAKLNLRDGNNYLQFLDTDKTFKFNNSWGAGEFTFHVNGGERLRIGSAGQLGLGGANYGTSGQVLTSQGSNAAPQWAAASGGIEEYDEWTVTANSTGIGWDNGIIGSNSNAAQYGNTVAVGRMTTTQNPLFTKIGTGMSFDVSTGVWTFPATGYWEVKFIPQIYTSGSGPHNWYVSATTDGGTTWKGGAQASGDGDGIYRSNNRSSSGAGNYSFDVHAYMNITNTTNQKIRYVYATTQNVAYMGSTAVPITVWSFKKIA